MTTKSPSHGGRFRGAIPARELFSTMALIRAFETSVAQLYKDGDIPGFVHTSLGQEAVAAGVCTALEPDDYLATTHRGHGHCLAKGVDVDGMMAELFARAEGICGGKGGSMHVADPSRGVLGANAIVGASLPLAVGAACRASCAARDGSRSRSSARARSTRAPSTSRSTWRRSGTCRCCSSARTTSTPSSRTAAA